MSLDCLPVCAGSPPSPSTSQQQILSYLWAWLATAVCEVERPRLGFVEQAGQGLCFQWGMLPHKSCPVGCREVYPPPAVQLHQKHWQAHTNEGFLPPAVPGGSTLIPASVLGQFNAVDGAVERCLLQAGIQLAEESVGEPLQAVNGDSCHVVIVPCHIQDVQDDVVVELQGVHRQVLHVVLVPLLQR